MGVVIVVVCGHGCKVTKDDKLSLPQEFTRAWMRKLDGALDNLSDDLYPIYRRVSEASKTLPGVHRFELGITCMWACMWHNSACIM